MVEAVDTDYAGDYDTDSERSIMSQYVAENPAKNTVSSKNFPRTFFKSSTTNNDVFSAFTSKFQLYSGFIPENGKNIS